MSISAITTSFKVEIGQDLHNFAVAGDVFKCALYTQLATLGAGTTVYTSLNEVSGTGYSAGGDILTNITPVSSGTTALYDFADLVIPGLTVTGIRSALIYNSTNGNRAVAVLDFGVNFSPVAQSLNITFPSVTPTTAFIRIK